jgi:uncharacterized protein (DUF952 family)
MGVIYKICGRAEWRAAQARGVYAGSAVDREDGFIHFSAPHQLRETAARHFAGRSDLLLVAFEAEGLGAQLKWEPSRGGDLFPHLHGTLTTSAALWAKPLLLSPEGHVFPPDTAS